jgi:hypothetical protein
MGALRRILSGLEYLVFQAESLSAYNCVGALSAKVFIEYLDTP